MRNFWLIPLAALALAACQAREPSTPQSPGAKRAAAPPSATTPLPAPTVQPSASAAAGACPPVRVQACPPAAGPARTARTHRASRARTTRYAAARPHRQMRVERRARQVDIPPYGGYRYEELEDREIQRRYAERRYEGGGHDRRMHKRHAERRHHRQDDHRGDAYEDRVYRAPPPPPLMEPRYEDRYSGGGYARRGGEAYEHERHARDYSRGPVVRRYRDERHGGGYVERRSGHVAESFSSGRRASGGVRRYEERSYEEHSRTRESYSGQHSKGPCCSAAFGGPAAGRDEHGFLTWPGKVPALP